MLMVPYWRRTFTQNSYIRVEVSRLILAACILSLETFLFPAEQGVINAMPDYKEGLRRDPGDHKPVNQL